MDAREFITVGMRAERSMVLDPAGENIARAPKMPAVFATPMMIMEMEMASADAIAPHLAPGWVTVGTEVDIRHPRRVRHRWCAIRTAARVVIAVERW